MSVANLDIAGAKNLPVIFPSFPSLAHTTSSCSSVNARPQKHQVFTDSGRTLRVETERKKGGSESEGARKAEVNREREREV